MLKKQGEKQKKTVLIGRLWQYLSRHKLLILLALICMFSSNVLALFGPKLSGSAIDAMGVDTGQVDFPRVLYYVGLMTVFYIVSAILSYALSLLMIRLSRHVIYDMRKDVFEKLSALPVSFFDRYQTGDIISVISYDIDTVNQSFSNDLLQVLQSIVIVVFSLVMMLSICACARAGVRRDDSALDRVHEIHHKTRTAAVSRPLEKARRIKRLCRGDDRRPKDDKGIRSGAEGHRTV